MPATPTHNDDDGLQNRLELPPRIWHVFSPPLSISFPSFCSLVFSATASRARPHVAVPQILSACVSLARTFHYHPTALLTPPLSLLRSIAGRWHRPRQIRPRPLNARLRSSTSFRHTQAWSPRLARPSSAAASSRQPSHRSSTCSMRRPLSPLDSLSSLVISPRCVGRFLFPLPLLSVTRVSLRMGRSFFIYYNDHLLCRAFLWSWRGDGKGADRNMPTCRPLACRTKSGPRTILLASRVCSMARAQNTRRP